MVRMTINTRNKVIKSWLISILNMIFKYGSVDIWRNSIDLTKLLNCLFENIQFQIKNNKYDAIWQRSTTFFQDIICFLQKESRKTDSILVARNRLAQRVTCQE